MKRLFLLLTACSFLIFCVFLEIGVTAEVPAANSGTIIPDNALEPCARFVGDNEYCELLEQDGSARTLFATVRSKYHDDTNRYFQEKIKKLAGTTFREDPKRMQTAGETEIALIYTERQDALLKYHSALITLKQKAETPSPSTADRSTESALESAINFQSQIEYEQQISERALRLTIQSYAEMRLFYPLHKELETLITELQKLQKAWIGLVKEVSRMPAKFINAARNFAS